MARASGHYRLGTVPIVLGSAVVEGTAEWRDGMIMMPPETLTHPRRDPVLAHELGHAVLGHGRGAALTGFTTPATLGDWNRLQHAKELDANAKAVEILAVVKGWHETTALWAIFDWLCRVDQGQRRGRTSVPGHLPAADEWRDLLARFPQHREITARWRCP